MLSKLTVWISNNWFLTCVVILASSLRLYNLDYQSVWIDEIHTLNEANPKHTLSELYASILSSDPHPPLYFILMHSVFSIFGYTTFVLRLFSAFIGIVSVIGIYKLGEEIFNKKAGQYSALLLAINYFHLTYSQEGRMYALFMLATIFSFYYLIKLIKNPSIRGVVYYTLLSSVMIYCHFFALFVLVSQYVVLLFFIIRPYKTNAKQFFYYTLASGITTILLYLPTYSIFKKAAERDSIWISMPTIDVYTQIFKDFFGQSEIVLFFILVLTLIFFVNLIQEKGSDNLFIDPEKNKLIFVFFVLFVWIGITLIIPLIRSYIALPMLINRYFICIVPAIIIMVSIGLYYVQSTVVRYLILCLIFIFSLADIIVVKKYYTKIDKTQFRELSNFIISNNSKNDPVVSSLSWYFPFFLDNEKVNMKIIDSSLEDYIQKMMNNPQQKKEFWYVEAQGQSLTISEPSQKYLAENFVAVKKMAAYHGWTSHYTFIEDGFREVDISKYSNSSSAVNNTFRYYLDEFLVDTVKIKMNGWAYFEGQDATDSEISLVLVNEGKAFKLPCYPINRGDVATYYKIPFNLDNCGFELTFLTNKILPGKYQLGIILTNKQTNKDGFMLTNNFFTKL